MSNYVQYEYIKTFIISSMRQMCSTVSFCGPFENTVGNQICMEV